jgi:hypothetical protein
MPNTVDRAYFYANFPKAALFGKTLNASRQQGFDAIFDEWDQIDQFDILEWLAYALGTAWHETGGQMQPVREGFAASDAAAYQAVTTYCANKGIDNYAKRHANGNSYYGRGYVQLTHSSNYSTMSQRLGLGTRLYDHPDDVLTPAIGGKILLVGMIEGLFRPAKGRLFDYFNGTQQKWLTARDLINGDKNSKPAWANGLSIGELVSQYGKGFLGVLREH